jgi:NADPH2:quinone reductase
MKAAVYYETGAPSVFKYEDVYDPQLFASGVIIEVKAISIEGGDVLNRAGGEMPSKPHIVGYQCAGVIKEVGASVQDRQAGQEVVAIMPFGSHAELVGVAAMQTWPVPEGADLQEMACVPIPFGTADDCLFDLGRLQAGENVLIQAGAGGVGMAAIQLAKQAGATVLATASSDEKLERLKEFGLDYGINYTTEEFPERTKELTGGKGADLIVDSVGTTLQGSIQALAYKGRLVSVGNAGRAEQRMIDITQLSERNLSFTGAFFGGAMMMEPLRARALVEKHLQAVAEGKLRVVIDKVFPLSEAAAAHEYIESRQAFGRVLLTP